MQNFKLGICFILSILVSFYFASCKKADINIADSFYLDQPDLIIPLAKQIKNLAGIAIDTSGTLWAVNDKDPTLFVIDLVTKKTKNQITIAKDNDYRGVAYANNFAYLARNDGFIKRVSLKTNNTVKTFFNPIEEVKNIGGIYYKHSSNQLLVINAQGESENRLAIYSFDLEEEKFNTNIAASISISEIKEHLKSSNTSTENLTPTGLSADPINGNLYISLASQNVVVTDNAGKIKTVTSFTNPEHGNIGGICFDQSGNIMIGFQGKTSSAAVYKYKRK